MNICFVIASCSSNAADFEVSCPATLPPLSGHLPELPAGWDVVTSVLPLDLAGSLIGDERGSAERPDRIEHLPNGEMLKTWSFDRATFTPYVLCLYFYTQVLLIQKIPPDMKSCQSLWRADPKLAKFEKITCSR